MAESLRFLYGLQSFGIKLGLENIAGLLNHLGDPHKNFRSVHVAGTNGKGSTAAMVASMLIASGRKTGLYTSPHLVRFNERIRIDGVEIPDEALVRFTALLRERIKTLRATFFEATTAIAFAWFAEQNVEIAVVEVGLGGMYDATNVLLPDVSVITTIGLDHTEFLGGTVEAIAVQKGGIIKPGVPVVAGLMPPAADRVLRSRALQTGSAYISVADHPLPSIRRSSITGIELDAPYRGSVLRDLRVSLAGSQQQSNVAMALRVIEQLSRDNRLVVNRLAVRRGLADIRGCTGLRGRMELLRTDPVIMCDVAHNPQAVERLIPDLRRLLPGDPIVVFGIMADKDYHSVLRAFKNRVRMLVAVAPETPRALAAIELLAAARSHGIPSVHAGGVTRGVELAGTLARDGEYVLLVGSHFLLGEALAEPRHRRKTANH